MSYGHSDRYQKLKAVFIVAAFLSLTALVIFKSGVVDLTAFNSKPAYDKELLSSVSIRGMVKLQELKLSPTEIKRLNFAAIRHRNMFNQFNLHLNYADKEGGKEILPDTDLVMGVQLKLDGGGEISSWAEKVDRKSMVPSVVQYIDEAAIELERIRKLEGAKPFKRLYL